MDAHFQLLRVVTDTQVVLSVNIQRCSVVRREKPEDCTVVALIFFPNSVYKLHVTVSEENFGFSECRQPSSAAIAGASTDTAAIDPG